MTTNTHDSANRKLQEINRYKDGAFPIGIYTVTPEGITPEGRGYRDLHWHEELQLTRVESGTLEIRVDGIDYTLHQGDALLINRNLLHITTNLSPKGKYISLNFPDRVLGFFPGSRMEQNYVFPYTRTYLFSAILLHEETPWQKEMLDLLAEILALFGCSNDANTSAIHNTKTPLCPEYQIATKLTALWSILIRSTASTFPSPSRTYLRRQDRIHTMLSYIHENYASKVRLEDIAAVAHISTGECCRCFRDMVRTSPNQYLLEYRIAKSKELLLGTDQSITDIGYAVGFNDSSYFIYYFRKITGMTPKEYIEHAR